MEENKNGQIRFSQTEKDALSGKIPMTLEILKKCFMTCIYAGDDQQYDDIKKRFPVLTDALGWEKPYAYENRSDNPRFLCGGWQANDPAGES